jgi:hypothetical protein
LGAFQARVFPAGEDNRRRDPLFVFGGHTPVP